MNEDPEDEFELYYQEVCDALIGMDETTKPDRDTVREDFEAGVSVEDSAQSLYDDWNLEE